MTFTRSRTPRPTRHLLLLEILHLLRPFWKAILGATVAGAIGGSAMAWLLSIINTSLSSSVSIAGLVGFGLLAILSLAGQSLAGVGNSIIGQKIVARLRQQICRRILNAPLATVENAKTHRLLAVLNNDVEKVAEFAHHFAGYATALTVVLGCLAYLFLLSPMVLAFALGLVALGAWLNHVAMSVWIVRFEEARKLEDTLQKHYRSIIEGAKELRLNRTRRRLLELQKVIPLTERIAGLNGRAFAIFWAADTVSIALLLGMIGAILAARPYLGIGNDAITGFIIVMLFAKGPVEELAGALPVFGQAQVAFKRISALSVEFRTASSNEEVRSVQAPMFSRDIELRDIRHSRFPGESAGFTLDIPRLSIARGEVVFIVGGNGSGKTTLLKVLLGLYQPASGTLLLDGRPVAEEATEAYRQLFSAVFAEYHLFEDIVAAPGALDRATAWLHRLDLAYLVDLEAGCFSTVDLSTGQRKRLALLNAILEDREVLVFDEWAADQDPGYRNLFYTTILPELRRAGRTVIAVSHDDRYFDTADRVVHMERGRITSIVPGHPRHATETQTLSVR
ncbi:cyclic peptide export ABC transporter [Ancylobacter sp.]|uniref:cyclic peptide export ABC transporter n=1 Tax=Ancylobacter sp. TaxID=1872567 RepID=UPI003C7E918D